MTVVLVTVFAVHKLFVTCSVDTDRVATKAVWAGKGSTVVEPFEKVNVQDWGKREVSVRGQIVVVSKIVIVMTLTTSWSLPNMVLKLVATGMVKVVEPG